MTRDHGPAPRASVVINGDRLLNAREAGALVHLCGDRFKRMASKHRFLAANTVRRGVKPYWLLSTIVTYLHGLKAERAS